MEHVVETLEKSNINSVTRKLMPIFDFWQGAFLMMMTDPVSTS